MKYLLTVSTILLSVLLGQAVHELGHVLHARTSGARVIAVDLVPHRFSSTAVLPNPHPLWVVWGGPIWGCVIPLVVVTAAWRFARSSLHLARFFAGLCLVGNGAYLGVGWTIRAGDAGDLLRLGCPVWVMVLFGATAVPVGFALWNGTGGGFGFGPRAAPVSPRLAWGVSIGLVALIALELVFSAVVTVESP